MSFEFVLPLCKDDLLNKTGVNQFTVEEVLPIRLLPSKLKECKSSYRSQGPTATLKCFDSIFSVLCHFNNIETEIKEDAWDITVKAVVAHANSLPALIDETCIEPDERSKHLNIVKMNSYLLCQFIDKFEAEATKPLATAVQTGKGRGKAQKRKDTTTGIDWEFERERGVQALSQLVKLNIQRLWDPPVAEEEFVNLVTCTCYKLLENANLSRCKTTRDAIFHLLGTMVKRYNHALGASLKVIQLLQHFDHLCSPLTQAVEIFVNEYGVKSIVSEIMREIGRMDSRDLARDTSGTRSFAAFLVELSERIPAIMLPSISVLVTLLDGEAYTMRNCVLSVMGEIVIRTLSKEDLDHKHKTDRDQFLDKLEDHVHDVHAFVRSKVLQIWLCIVNEKALPLPRQQHLLDLVIGRLQDKSSSVRKYAIQLLTALLRSNPFAAKLPLEELRVHYEKEKEKLHELMPDQPLELSNEGANLAAEEEWAAIEENLKKVIDDIVQAEESEETCEFGEDDTAESTVAKIIAFLHEGQLQPAVRMFQAASETWSDHDLFIQSKDAEGDDDDVEQEVTPQSTVHAGIRALFLGTCEEKTPDIAVAVAAEEAEKAMEGDETGVVNEVSKQQVLVQYLKAKNEICCNYHRLLRGRVKSGVGQDSMQFASKLQTAVPIICQLLGSKNTTDIMEAIEFFVTGFEFGVTNTMLGIRRMLALVWSKEPIVKEKIVKAYKTLYLSPVGGNQRAKSLAIVKNLTALTFGATMGDITSLEELVQEFISSEDIGAGVIQMLWERFTMKIANTTEEESRGALLLLSMAAGAEVQIVRSNIDVLVKEGLGPRATNNFGLARDACLALLKLAATNQKKGAVAEEPFRLEQEHEIFTRLSEILVQGVDKLNSRNWIPLAEQAVNVIYRLAEHPDAICGEIIQKLVAIAAKDQSQTSIPDVESEKEEESQTISPVEFSCPSGVLTRLLSISGHIALRQLVHLDVQVFGELKRRRAVQEQQAENKKKAHNNSSISKTKDNETIEEELGLTGAAAEDAESDYIRKVSEEEIVSGGNLLAMLRPILVSVCNNQVKYPDPELRTAATLALAKFMMVSSEFCEAHLQLLFTLLEKSPNPVIRANTIIALGDLTFRFPNLIEPWTPHLYARLRDDSPQVRKNTMMVLTHLILNDMVKVKGQISEMATCIVDEDERIASLAKLFFHELSKKGNAVYNIMPDIISRLSDPDVGVLEDHFRTILKYLFSFIQKDKQCESLVEKLCHRFRATKTERQWRDLAYCLSMLSYSEKSIRKLQENFACFNDKLGEESVYACFMTIIGGAKKFAKPEAKVLVEELEKRIEDCHNKGVDDNEAAEKASKATAAAKARRKTAKTPAKTPGKRKGRQRRQLDSDSEEEEVEDSPVEDESTHPAKRGVSKGAKNKPKLSFSSDEDSELELFDVDQSTDTGKTNQDNVSGDENADPNIRSPSPLFRTRTKKKSVNQKKKLTPRKSTRTKSTSVN